MAGWTLVRSCLARLKRHSSLRVSVLRRQAMDREKPHSPRPCRSSPAASALWACWAGVRRSVRTPLLSQPPDRNNSSDFEKTAVRRSFFASKDQELDLADATFGIFGIVRLRPNAPVRDLPDSN